MGLIIIGSLFNKVTCTVISEYYASVAMLVFARVLPEVPTVIFKQIH